MAAISAHDLLVRAPEPAPATYDAIIIGSGMSGLTSAVILAKEGKRVLVLEQHYRPGGYLHRFFRKGGVQFDVGFHYLGAVESGQVLGTYLDYCGVRSELEFIPLDPEGYDDLIFPEHRFVIPAGADRFRARLLEHFPHERQGIDTYFRDLQTICDGFAFYRLHTEQDLNHADRWMSRPLGAYLASLFTDPQIMAVLAGQNPLYGVEPARTPTGLHALVSDSFMQNPYTINGGGEALAQAMVRQIRRLGGEVKTRRAVREILVDDDRCVRGVHTERGETYHAPIIISCAHPKVTVRLLPDEVLRPGFRRRVLGMEDGVATLSVFGVTDVDLSRYARKNIYHYKRVDIDALYNNADRPHEFAFITVPTAREGRAKNGKHQVIVLAFLDWRRVEHWQASRSGERGDDYEAFKAREAEDVLRLVYEAMPELRGNLDVVDVATPLTNRDFAASERGAAYGIHHSVEQSGRYGLRPRTRVGGLYMTGQSVLMPGVCGVTISAFHTCSHILGAEYLIQKVRAHGN